LRKLEGWRKKRFAADVGISIGLDTFQLCPEKYAAGPQSIILVPAIHTALECPL
jgi:hypothetical protein